MPGIILGFKILISCSFTAVLVMILATHHYGRRLHDHRNESALREHKRSAKHTGWLLLGSLVVTEGFARIVGDSMSWMLAIHLAFVGMFGLSYVLMFWITGLVRPSLHKHMAICGLGCYCIGFGLGLILLWKPPGTT